MKLTKRTIDAMAYQGREGQRQVVWDKELPGFGLRVYPTGKKAFVLSYRFAGRKRLMTLGAYGVLTIDEARKQARAYLVGASSGTDPLEKRKREAQGETVKELCATYMARHAKPHKKSWLDDQRRIDKYILPAWGNRRVSSITGSDAAALHSHVHKNGPYAANRTLALVSTLFEQARRWGIVPEDRRNPARSISRYREKKRDRWVSPQELPRLAQAINTEPNVYVRMALWLYLLTGVRKRELLAAQWADIDWQRQEIRLDDTKPKRMHYVPLSAPAMAILRDLPRLEGNPYILPGPIHGRPLVNINKPWNRIRKAAGVEDIWLHDLRRTVGSWLAQSGNSLHLIGRVLNHSNPNTTAVYARFGQDHVRQALEEHGARIMGIAGKQASAEVVSISDKAQNR